MTAKRIETELGIEKLCPKCQEFYPVDDEFFYRRKGTDRNGHQNYISLCKACYEEKYSYRNKKKEKIA